MILSFILTLLSITHLIASSLATGPTCTTISIPVSISAQNVRFPADFTTTSLLSVVGALGAVVFDSLITDSYTIVGTYCEPEVLVEGRKGTVQVLVHGATYTREYWRGDGYSDRYSWVAAASKAGYPTLAIDRLGNGDSDHPDPILAVQYPVEVETIHQIIVKLRAGTLPPPLNGRKFTKVIYVGHSYGSIIGNALATSHPQDTDALLLTGWSSTFITLIPTVLGTAVVLPASLTLPRFKSLPLGYLTINSQPGFRGLFFASPGTYDPALFDYDFANRGTITAGEAATLAFGVNTASEYTGKVFVVTGERDAIFCNVLGLNILLGGILGTQSECGDAETGYLGRSRSLFPRASAFDAFVVPDAGHCWQLHYTAEKAFGTVHEWLAKQGF
ncbi:Alpha/Beta hydrolase protein [Leptodontidium sp. MPI-SDFR-AT-0119]|nr:Alpha/Beta hydrolase protein [Leptodontidium sp. MPI-SDFR-AT-0119]